MSRSEFNSDGRREAPGMNIGPSEAETFWTPFLPKLVRRGLRGIKLVVCDAHAGVKATVRKGRQHRLAALPRPLHAQHTLAHAGESRPRVVAAFIATAFAQDDAETTTAQWCKSPTSSAPKLPKLARTSASGTSARGPYPPKINGKAERTNRPP